MTLFLTFLIAMFALGIMPQKRPPAQWAVILGACLLACIGYFFLGQI